MNDEFQHAFHVSGNSFLRTRESDEAVNGDPRGLLLVWEEPKHWAKYVMSADPTEGITNWSRGSRREDDYKTDNGVIEIFRPNAIKMPLFKNGKPVMDKATGTQQFVMRDLQVAEFAAPVDAVELSRVANVMGRMYAGEESDQCEFVYESYPGPGPLMTQELIRLGYGNLWQWQQFANTVAEDTNIIGWQATPRSTRILWTRARMHLMSRRAKLMSPWAVEEYANAVVDMQKMAAKASYGVHDDRLRACNLAFWVGHRWTDNPERTNEPVTERLDVDWQHLAPVMGGDQRSYKEAWADAVENWSDD
jgi:hypothetical protein